MKTSKTVFQILQTLMQTGYYRVSLSELAWHTKLSKEQVLSSLRNTGHTLTTQDGEHYLKLGN